MTFWLTYWRLSTTCSLLLEPEQLGGGVPSSLYVSTVLIGPFDANAFMHYYCSMGVSVLRLTNVAIVVMDLLEVYKLFDILSAAALVSKNFATRVSNGSLMTTYVARPAPLAERRCTPVMDKCSGRCGATCVLCRPPTFWSLSTVLWRPSHFERQNYLEIMFSSSTKRLFTESFSLGILIIIGLGCYVTWPQLALVVQRRFLYPHLYIAISISPHHLKRRAVGVAHADFGIGHQQSPFGGHRVDRFIPCNPCGFQRTFMIVIRLIGLNLVWKTIVKIVKKRSLEKNI